MLTQTYSAYRDLTSFSCTVDDQIGQVLRKGSKPEQRALHYRSQYAISKTDGFVSTLTADNGDQEHIVFDNQTVSLTTTDPKALPLRYVQQRFSSDSIPSNAIQCVKISRLRPAERTLRFVPELVFGVDSYPADSNLWQMEAPAKIDGEVVDVVGFTVADKAPTAAGQPSASPTALAANKHRLMLYISRRDHLLRQVRSDDLYPNGMADTITETYQDVRANPPLDASLFVFRPALFMVAVSDLNGLYAALDPTKVDIPTIRAGARVGHDPLPFKANDLDGKPVVLSDYHGKVVLLDFWATWCAPCIHDIPFIMAAYQTYHPQGLEAIGFAIDRDAGLVKAFAESKQMNWRMVLNDVSHQDVANKGYVPDGVGIPYVVLIGRDGKVAASGRMTKEVLNKQIESALRAGASGDTARVKE